jgi:2'-5' RNA ligase
MNPVDRVASDEVVRAFFAVELSAELRDEARVVADALRTRVGSAADVRWTREESWHVTLRFLGQFPAHRLGELLAAAGEAVHVLAPFELRLGAAIAFPPRRARVLALDLVPHPPLAAAAAALEHAATGSGFAAEERAFKPHLTLGRVKSGSLRAREVAELSAAGAAVQTVRDLVLFRSELHPSGARYTPLERIALGGNDHP